MLLQALPLHERLLLLFYFIYKQLIDPSVMFSEENPKGIYFYVNF
jgi:hypothetical protein